MSNRMAARFQEIDLANPEFWEMFERFTLELIRRGFAHYSAATILHRIRWETATPLEDDSGYRICNIWSPFYARKFRAKHPAYADFFRYRPSMADEA